MKPFKQVLTEVIQKHQQPIRSSAIARTVADYHYPKGVIYMIYNEILAPETNGQVSEPVVMKSAAGYYVGRAYFEDGGWFPHSRETGYFRSVGEAQEALLHHPKEEV